MRLGIVADIDDGGSLVATHRSPPFDVGAVVGELRQRRHPNAEFVSGVLAGQRPQIREAADRTRDHRDRP